MEYASSNYYTNNEDKFGFLVFDRMKADSFSKRYSPVQVENKKLDSSFKELTEKYYSFETNKRYSKHTLSPDKSDYELAMAVLKAGNGKDDKVYFQGALDYLFFYECLPDEFRSKWVQTGLGDFEFNVTFFNRLRMECEVFDDHIYGNTGYWDEKLKAILQDHIYTEITADNAKLIKDCINQNTAFNDDRLQPDKDNFIHFLEQAINKKWRLFLIDKN